MEGKVVEAADATRDNGGRTDLHEPEDGSMNAEDREAQHTQISAAEDARGMRDGAARTMIPPPPRSRFAALPRLPTGGEGKAEPSSASKKSQAATFTSVFQSPSKSAAVKQPAGVDTPSKLARFREANWMAKETKKRAREGEGDSAIQLPKSKIVTRLFAEEEAPVNGDEEQSGDSGLREEDSHEMLEKKLQVELALQDELVRDSARLNLRADALKEEIDFFFNLLATIEGRVVEARVAVESARNEDSAIDDAKTASLLKLAEGLQRIIGAAKPQKTTALEATPPAL